MKEQRCHTAGRISKGILQAVLPTYDCDYYFCGPKPFMTSLAEMLGELGVPEQQTHFEFFGPRQDLKVPEKVSLS